VTPVVGGKLFAFFGYFPGISIQKSADFWGKILVFFAISWLLRANGACGLIPL
jgi:hypothetical protein